MNDRGRVDAPEVTVILCTYNRARLLEDTLAALALQHTPSPLTWELLVVDNNSTDDTRAVVEAFARIAPMPVRYLYEPIQGKSNALNTGVAVARGDILAFTDDDVTPTADWVARTSSIVRQRAADGAGGRILPRWSSPPPTWLASDRTLLSLLALQDLDQPCSVTAENRVLIFGANMVLRRDVFLDVGPFNTAKGRLGTKLADGEDTELIDRAVAAGKRIIYDPSLVVWHRIGPNRLRKRYFRKLRFDASESEAIGTSDPSSRTLLGVPLYLLMVLPLRLGQWLLARAVFNPCAFQKELALFSNLGFVVGHARRRWRLAARRPPHANS